MEGVYTGCRTGRPLTEVQPGQEDGEADIIAARKRTVTLHGNSACHQVTKVYAALGGPWVGGITSRGTGFPPPRLSFLQRALSTHNPSSEPQARFPSASPCPCSEHLNSQPVSGRCLWRWWSSGVPGARLERSLRGLTTPCCEYQRCVLETWPQALSTDWFCCPSRNISTPGPRNHLNSPETQGAEGA